MPGGLSGSRLSTGQVFAQRAAVTVRDCGPIVNAAAWLPTSAPGRHDDGDKR